MHASSSELFQAESWQKAMQEAFTSSNELIKHLGLSDKLSLGAQSAATKFPLRVPKRFVDKIAFGDINDPLLKQILPLQEELNKHPEYLVDPLNEQKKNPSPGLLHKYKSRALLILTQACAIHCRYCFRREFNYQENKLNPSTLTETIHYIQQHKAINEIILSGGDPLMLSDEKLQVIFNALTTLPQLKTIRLHSRVPIVLPERLTPSLFKLFAKTPKKIVMVVHTNHPNEFKDSYTQQALQQFSEKRIPIFNQSVLLKGINDNPDTLIQLSYQLFDNGIMPYYLNTLDKVTGTEHFAITQKQTQKLYWALLENLPGYLVPKLVQENPALPFKVPLCLDIGF